CARAYDYSYAMDYW
nr:immunoglobulin heavy chain junction region [Mus musculus]MBK4196552.1 immunoglobulin heavy chain junction region [Mus musculus]